jgi:hypothetical protein
MRYESTAGVLFVCLMAVPAWGQTPAPEPELVAPPAWAFNDIACSPGLAPAKPDKNTAAPPPPHRVIGSQDTAIRDLLGPGDTLVVSGGSNGGLETGQRYFVRRLLKATTGAPGTPSTVHTAGWIQILGVDASVATATVVHACDGILLDDYLEPFTPPMIAARPSTGTTPSYENMGHIMTGADGVHSAGQGQVITIDRGSNAGVTIGQRFVVFRTRNEQKALIAGRSLEFNQNEGRLPLVEIGQVLVVSVRPDNASVQVLGSKDAITKGDLIAPIQ